MNLLFPDTHAELHTGYHFQSQLLADPERLVKRTNVIMIGNANGGQSNALRTHQ
jgi:hypothetical protein